MILEDGSTSLPTQEDIIQLEESSNTFSDSYPVTTTPIDLSAESKYLIEQIIAETDEQKSRDLTHLFNANQNKKTMVRVDKLNNLLDTITDHAIARFSSRPDELSNKELFDGLKVVQDLVERGQKQVSGAGEVPLIQVNQQTNEVNIGNDASKLSRDSREKVKNAVLSLIKGLTTEQSVSAEYTDISDTETLSDYNSEGSSQNE